MLRLDGVSTWFLNRGKHVYRTLGLKAYYLESNINMFWMLFEISLQLQFLTPKLSYKYPVFQWAEICQTIKAQIQFINQLHTHFRNE